MKVSIITVVFNNKQTITDTINSVLSQTYSDLEYIIVDGNSTDGTLGIINTFKSEISKIISEPDKGIYDAMNKGLKLATGDIIGILNGDDIYHDNNVISNVVQAFESSSADAVYGDLDYVAFDDLSKVKRKWRTGVYKPNAFLWGWMPPHPSFFVKREMYKKYGSFRLDFKTAADYELMLRFIHLNKISISYLPKVLVKMREGGASNASFKARLNANKEDRRAWKVNGLKQYFFTTILKPLRKLKQLF